MQVMQANDTIHPNQILNHVAKSLEENTAFDILFLHPFAIKMILNIHGKSIDHIRVQRSGFSLLYSRRRGLE